MIVFVVWFLVGAVIGGVAGRLMRSAEDSGAFVNVVIGIVAALAVAWFVAPRLGLVVAGTGLVNLGTLAVALLGAIAALALVTTWRHRAPR